MMVSEALAGALRSGREEMNARFLAARRALPALDGEGFLEFIARTLDPLAQATAALRGDRVLDVVTSAYELGLELYLEKLVGPGARAAAIEEAWRRIGTAAIAQLLLEPRHGLAALANGAHQIAITPGARVDAWIATMEQAAPQSSDLDTLLRVGQVAAWRAGLAHYRASALRVADSLSPDLALSALGLAKGDWSTIRDGLASSPWFSIDGSPTQPAFVIGAFHGFGGVFREPPLVTASEEDFFAKSGEEHWLVTADAFGATFHRAAPTEFDAASSGGSWPKGYEVRGSALVTPRGVLELDLPGGSSSRAANRHTLALTAPHSHAITLIPLAS